MATRTAKAMGLLATAIAVLAIPTSAGAEYFVPPGNSAATQYTEAVPTAGGHRDSEKGRGGSRSPAEVLGERKTQRLAQQGADGRRVAEVVATTAPNAATGVPPAEQSAPPADRDDDNGGRKDNAGDDGDKRERPAEDAVPASSDGGPSGSSGVGEVLGQATGASSSGQLGVLLPLAIAAIAAWALAFLLRQRKRPTS